MLLNALHLDLVHVDVVGLCYADCLCDCDCPALSWL